MFLGEICIETNGDYIHPTIESIVEFNKEIEFSDKLEKQFYELVKNKRCTVGQAVRVINDSGNDIALAVLHRLGHSSQSRGGGSQTDITSKDEMMDKIEALLKEKPTEEEFLKRLRTL